MKFLGSTKTSTQIWRFGIAVVGTSLLFQFVSLYLSWPKQMTMGGISVVIAMILNRSSKSKIVTLSLMLLSIAATLRYGWWRVQNMTQYFTDESNHRLSIDSVLMLILLSAEAYTVLVMVLGFMQTSSPLRRRPVPLPADEDLWPHVDVLIPTYNEPLSLVRYTAIAANNIDYPQEKLHVYILDDGTRPGFKEFAEQVGVGYVVREKHDHAKAGNINHALMQMSSPLVAIFDCDHVPTRSFLQVTAGWFLEDEKLAMLQTPHYFYSPDPFERNLLQFKTIPNEAGLFYGIIQDGSDLWNATFFCGSCAVIRRSALDQVGGIATETVTEDAHTSLRMQKKGWNTAYINVPQAAGLATETLAAHVGQRVRWARGMIQILRTDNPLLASGMKLTQRLCYFNAMLHFMYAVPRLIFLCAPLVYMLAGRTIIPGYWATILAYGIPHLFISSITNSRVQGRYRHSFWNEIYETVLAPYILLPTLLALINPKLGKFNVTDKGSTLMETTFDRNIAAPTTWLLLANVLGICAVPYWLLIKDPTHRGTIISNLVWILFNMIILGVAAAVANEQQQRRSSVRISAELPIHLHLANGDEVIGITKDMSVGGAWLNYSGSADFKPGEVVMVSFPAQTGDQQITGTVLGGRGNSLRLRFKSLSVAEEETLTCALYSRADSWINAKDNLEVDRPLLSLLRVMRLSLTGFRQVLGGLLPRRKSVPTNTATQKKAIAAASGLLILVCGLSRSGSAQFPGAQVTDGALAVAGQLEDPRSKPTLAAVSPPPASVTLFTAPTTNVTTETATVRLTLKDMGVDTSIELRGPHSYNSSGFVLGHSRIPGRATLNLTYHFSAALMPHNGTIKVSLNSTPIAAISAPAQPQAPSEYAFIALPIPPDLLIRNNQLTFEFTGQSSSQLDPKALPPVLANIGATSTLMIAGDYVALKRELTFLPLPFFDADVQTPTKIPIVFLAQPSARMLQAAGVVASWLGTLSKGTSVRFSVAVGDIPPGNVIVIANGSITPTTFPNVPASGGSLSLRSNPSDPEGTALVVAGSDENELLNAARSLSLMTVANSNPGSNAAMLGDTVHIGNFQLPPPRAIDDAPRWLTTSHLTSLWSSSSEQSLQSDGSTPVPVYFRTPPDLYYGETQNVNLKLTYRYNALPITLGSALRVYLNGTLLNEAQLLPGTEFADRQRSVLVPAAKMRPFGNTLNLSFDLVPTNPDSVNQDPTNRLSGSILENSYFDLRGLAHWASMPNLELFANAGFPFTRKADLEDTVVVLPATPTAEEITLFLYLMSHCGTQTGYPSLRVQVAGPDVVMRPDRDYLVIGGVSNQPTSYTLSAFLPVTLDDNGVHVKQSTSTVSKLLVYWRSLNGDFSQRPQPSNQGGRPDLILEGMQSPFFPGRSIILVSIRDESSVESFAEAFLDRSQSSDISQTVSLFRHGTFSSYTLDTSFYHVGSISRYALMRIWLAQYFWILIVFVTAISLILAQYAHEHLELLATERLGGVADLLIHP